MKAGIQIKKLTSHEFMLFQDLLSLFKEVFEMEASGTLDSENLIKLLERPEFIVLTAIIENKVVGGLTAYELPMYHGKYSEVFIYDIGVRSEFQRMGIGKLLISSLQAHCREKGIKEIFVSAQEGDQHALDFYRSTGGKAEKVVHFNYLLE